jgi:hypothetical protein
MSDMMMGYLRMTCDIVADKVAEYPGSNQHLFFHKLLVEEPRSVTMSYYLNALFLLGQLCRKPNLLRIDYPGMDGSRSGSIQSVFAQFARLLLFHLSDRPELRVLWAMEALLTRMTKRALVSNVTARREIAAGVDLQRYLQPEEENAYLGPSPARTVIDAVDSIVLSELGAFFNRHYRRPERREFDVRRAREEYGLARAKFEPLERATDAAYLGLLQSLGQDWQNFTARDALNRNFDKLGHGVCDVLTRLPDLLPLLPKDCKDRLAKLARLSNPFARQCCSILGIVVEEGDDPERDVKLQRIFDPEIDARV